MPTRYRMHSHPVGWLRHLIQTVVVHLKMLWRKRHKGISKEEAWRRYEMFDLFDDLDKALEILQRRTNVENRSSGIGKFLSDFEEEVADLRDQNVQNFEMIIEWFSGENSWVTMLNSEEKELVKRIRSRAERWNQEHEKYLK